MESYEINGPRGPELGLSQTKCPLGNLANSLPQKDKFLVVDALVQYRIPVLTKNPVIFGFDLPVASGYV